MNMQCYPKIFLRTAPFKLEMRYFLTETMPLRESAPRSSNFFLRAMTPTFFLSAQHNGNTTLLTISARVRSGRDKQIAVTIETCCTETFLQHLSMGQAVAAYITRVYTKGRAAQKKQKRKQMFS